MEITLRYNCRPAVTRRMYPDLADSWAVITPSSQAHARQRASSSSGEALVAGDEGRWWGSPASLFPLSLMEKYPSEKCNSASPFRYQLPATRSVFKQPPVMRHEEVFPSVTPCCPLSVSMHLLAAGRQLARTSIHQPVVPGTWRLLKWEIFVWAWFKD